MAAARRAALKLIGRCINSLLLFVARLGGRDVRLTGTGGRRF